MRPSQILDAHGDLLSRLDDNLFQGAMGALIAGQVAGKIPPAIDTATRDRLAMDAALSFSRSLRGAVRGAEAYRVTEDMVDLLTFAADSLEADDTWDRSLAPTGCGIVRFDKPVSLGEWKTDGVSASWLIWGPGDYGDDGKVRTYTYWLTDSANDPFIEWVVGKGKDAARAEKIRRIVGPWSLIGWDSFPDGRSLGEPRIDGRTNDAESGARMVASILSDEPSRLATRLARLTAHADRLDAALAGDGDVDDIDLEAIDADVAVDPLDMANDARLVHALWLLLGQTITTLHDEPIDRHARKRAVRKGLPPRVTTVALRRAESRPAEGESHVQWQHRWITRGHWRWQPCGEGRRERRRIWIAPFVKGPEGAPLKQSEKLYDLRR
jgi:hypothetical protein